MTDYRFDLGDKDMGYNRFVPYKDKDEPPTDYSEYANRSDMNYLIPKQGKNKGDRFR